MAADPPRFPLADHLDMTVKVDRPGRARAHIDVDHRHLNPNGVVHGAVLFAMIDTAMGAAVVSTLDADHRCASIDVHLRFLAPVTSGPLDAVATIDHAGRRSVVHDGHIDSGYQRGAAATGAFVISRVALAGSG